MIYTKNALILLGIAVSSTVLFALVSYLLAYVLSVKLSAIPVFIMLFIISILYLIGSVISIIAVIKEGYIGLIPLCGFILVIAFLVYLCCSFHI